MYGEDITHVVYHYPCYDGFTAAWVFWTLVGEHLEFVPGQYGEPMPDLPDDARVVMVDVSWSRYEMIALNERVAELLVLDHHKTAEANLEGLDFAVFDMDRSGCGLAWDTFTGDPDRCARPAIVNHVEDRDLWRFKIDGTKEVHAYLSSLELGDFKAWEETADLLEDRPEKIYEEGKAILRYQERRYVEVGQLMHTVRLGDVVMPAANIGLAQFKSGGLHRFLLDNPEHEFAGAYNRQPDGRWLWSLRAREGSDCSDIAQAYGGGGHAGASGFVTTEDPVVVRAARPVSKA